MTRPGGTVFARRRAAWAVAVVLVLAAGARAAGPDSSRPAPAKGGGAAGAPAAGGAMATPSGPLPGQVGLYENESIRRTPVAGGTVGGGAGTATPAPATPWSLSRVPAALAAVLVLIVGLKWLMGKMSGGAGRTSSSRAMQVLARSAVSPRQQLLLIQIGKRLVVVANSGGAMSPLCQIEDPTEVASLIGQIRAERSSTPASSFKSLFGRANDDYEPPPPAMLKERARRDEREEPPQEQSIAADLLGRRETRDELTLSTTSAASLEDRASEAQPTPAAADDPAVAATSGELSELMAKVRRMSQGFQR